MIPRIYLASSWRNELQPQIVELLRGWGAEVYDFRNPPGCSDFSWEQICLGSPVTLSTLREALHHPIARTGYATDFGALRWCDACLLALPCGGSAHWELGWAHGAGKATAVFAPIDLEIKPELMISASRLLCGQAELREWFEEWLRMPNRREC